MTRSLNALRFVVAISAISVLAFAELKSQSPAPKKVCPPCAAVAAAQTDLDKIPEGARADHQWALHDHGIHVPGSDPDLERGKGATVVSIDTGVITHPLLPLIKEDGSTESGIDIHAADGLYGPGHTNTDPLVSGFLRFPGHGTKTSSVIVAVTPKTDRDNKKIEGDWSGVNIFGVASGARVITIRATEGVMLFDGPLGEVNADYHRIARALNEAAKPNGGLLGKKVDVVSMSLGGWPPTADLCAAVENATKAGVIVVVAAGNNVKKTKYPAKCPTAIAVAGSTYNRVPWSGSAGSQEVVVAAPAEGVWTAAVMDGAPCIEASTGTSFATAIVAGMAASWVAQHRKANTLPSNPVEAFRKALRETADPWSQSKWSRNYGSGIANLSKLLMR